MSLAAEVVAEVYMFEDASVKSGGPVMINFLHDLESLWWIAVVLVLETEIDPQKSAIKVEEDHISLQRDLANQLDSEWRSRASMILDEEDDRLKTAVHPALHNAVDILQTIRGKLVEAYKKLETDPANKRPYVVTHSFVREQGLYDFFAEQLHELDQEMKRTLSQLGGETDSKQTKTVAVKAEQSRSP